MHSTLTHTHTQSRIWPCTHNCILMHTLVHTPTDSGMQHSMQKAFSDQEDQEGTRRFYTAIIPPYYASVLVWIRMWMWVCVAQMTRNALKQHIIIQRSCTYIYTYIRMAMCECVCVNMGTQTLLVSKSEDGLLTICFMYHSSRVYACVCEYMHALVMVMLVGKYTKHSCTCIYIYISKYIRSI